MALPTTIVSAAGIRGYSPPFKSSAGNFYVVARTSTTTLDVYKATDPESSFTVQDATNNPSAAGTYTALSATQKDDVLYIASLQGVTVYEYHEFNMATDTWSVTDELIEDVKDDPVREWASIAVRSDGDVIVVYGGDTDRVMGVEYYRSDYARREGGSWNVGNALDAGGERFYPNPNIVKGPLTDDMHIVFQKMGPSVDDEVFQARTLDPANTLSTVDTDPLDHDQQQLSMNNGVAYDDAGTQRILFAAIRGSLDNDRIYVPATEDASDDIVLGTSFVDSSGESGENNVFVGIHSIAEFGGDIHQLFANNTDKDLWYTTSTDNGVTWSFPTEEIDAITVNYISANIYTRGGDTVMAYVYDDADTQKYNEKILFSGPFLSLFSRPELNNKTPLRM